MGIPLWHYYASVRSHVEQEFVQIRASLPLPDTMYDFHKVCQVTRRMRDHGDPELDLRKMHACARRASPPQILGAFLRHWVSRIIAMKRRTLCAQTHLLTSRRLHLGSCSTCPSRQFMRLSLISPKGCATSGKTYLVLILLARAWCSEHGRTKGPQLNVLSNDQSSAARWFLSLGYVHAVKSGRLLLYVHRLGHNDFVGDYK